MRLIRSSSAKDLVGGESGLCLLKECVDRVLADLFVEELDTENVLPLLLLFHLSLDPCLDKEDLCDLIERGGRVEVLPVADDIVALVEKVGELVFLEGLETLEKLLDVLVGGVGMGDVLDFFEVSRHFVFSDTPELCFAAVMGKDKRSIDDAGVGIALAVVCGG